MKNEQVPVKKPSGRDVEQQLEGVLKELRRRAHGIRSTVVADPEGLPMASDLDTRFDRGDIAAMSSLITQSADGVFGHLGLESAQVAVIEGREADIAVMDVGEEGASLLVVLEKGASLGLVKLEMKWAVGELCRLLGLATPARAPIKELFVIHRSGLLLRHYSDTLRTDDERDILSGMMVAVQQFVKKALATKTGDLEEFRYGHYTIFFVRGTHTVAAAVVDGDWWEEARPPIAAALHDFEARYSRVLVGWNGDMTAFHGIDECFSKVLRR